MNRACKRALPVALALPAILLLGCYETVQRTSGTGTSSTLSTISVAPASGVVADGVTTAVITVTVRSVSNEGLPGQMVQLAATGANNVLVQPTTTTDANGVATGLIASTSAETKSVFAVVNPGASQVVLSMAPVVQFIGDAGNISAVDSTVAGAPATNVIADGAQAATITVTLRDVNGNPVPGQTIQLSSTGSNNTIAQPGATTDASGVALGSLTSTKAEMKTVTATVNSGAVVLSQQAAIGFIGDAANISTVLSEVSAAPTNIQADGTSTSTLTVTLRDVNGNEVPGQVVELTATGSNNIIVQSPTPTDAGGYCDGTIASISPELKTITATVSPGAGAIVLSQAPTPRFVGDLIAPGDVRLFYGDGGSDQASIQTWEDSLSFWSSVSSSASANATIKWTLGGFRPNGNFELLLGALSDTTISAPLDFLRWDGNTWTVDWSSTAITAANADKRGFDLEFESSSGEALVVYSNNTPNPVFRTRSDGMWSPEANVFATPSGTTEVLWVELVGREGTDEIALVYADAGSRLHAVIWTGSAWDELGTETTLSATLSTVTESRAFDAAYESSSGDLLVVWGHQYTNEEIQYATKPAGSNAWTTMTLTNALARAKVVRLAAERGTDRIAAVLTEGIGDDDTVGLVWDGSNWTAISEVDNSSATNDRDAAIAWVGSSETVVLVYRDLDAGSEIDWVTWTPYVGWIPQLDVPVTGMGDIEAIQMRSVDERDELMVAFSDATSNLYAATYDGFSWRITNSGVPLVSSLSSLGSQPFCFSIKRAQ